MGKAALKKSVRNAGKPAAKSGKAKPAGKPAAGKAAARPAAARPSTKPPAGKPGKARQATKAAGRSAPKPAPAKPVAAKRPSAKPAASKPITPAGKSSKVATEKPSNGRSQDSHKPKTHDVKSARLDKPSRFESKPEPYIPIKVFEQASSSGDSKPKKNQAGLTVKELERFRDLLLEKRRELVGDMNSMEREALQSGDSGLSTLPIHMADMGTDNYEQEFTLGLVEKDRTLLREINHALAKIQNGTYGLCEGNGKPITKVRLEAQPWARYSIEFARLQEKSPIRR